MLDAVGVGDPYGDGFRAHDQRELLRTLDALDAAGLLRSQHFIHVRCELPAANALALFEPLAAHPRLRLISLMDHTPGQRQWAELDLARTYFTGKKGWSHAQFDAEVRHAPERQAQYAAPHRQWFADFARRHGVPLATHDDTLLAHVDEARALGAVMSEFPTTREAAAHAHAHGLTTVAGAPNMVRGGSHSGNVAAIELAQAGVLDVLSSDYVPASLLPGAWRLYRDAGFSLPEAMQVVSQRPAQVVGLTDRGALAPGLRADMLRVRELEGRPLVRATYVGGVRVA